MKYDTSWIRLEGNDQEPAKLLCSNCGVSIMITLPIVVDEFLSYMKTFIKSHKKCNRPKGARNEQSESKT